MHQYFAMSPHPQDQIDDEEDEVEQKSDQEVNANNNNQQGDGAHGNEVEEMLEQLAIDDAADEGSGQNRQGQSGSA